MRLNFSKFGLNLNQLISNFYSGVFLKRDGLVPTRSILDTDAMVTPSLPRCKNQTGYAPLIPDPPPTSMEPEAQNSCVMLFICSTCSNYSLQVPTPQNLSMHCSSSINLHSHCRLDFTINAGCSPGFRQSLARWQPQNEMILEVGPCWSSEYVGAAAYCYTMTSLCVIQGRLDRAY